MWLTALAYLPQLIELLIRVFALVDKLKVDKSLRAGLRKRAVDLTFQHLSSTVTLVETQIVAELHDAGVMTV